MIVLVTGAAGFLGSNLSLRLLGEGHRVIGLDNYTTGGRRNVDELRAHSRFRFVEHDAIEPFTHDGPLDWVMHLACPASPPRYLERPIETMRVMSEGTRHLLELAKSKSARFFLASTSEVYGDPHVHPQPETFWGTVNPVGPRSVYDEGKRFAEAMVTAYHRTFGMSVRISRFFNTYGPRMDEHDGRVVTNFVNQALRGEALTVYGDGSQTRSFQYVDDLLNGIVRQMEVEHHGPINLGNPEEYTMLQLAELVLELTGSKVPLRRLPLPEDDPKQRRPDISLAMRVLGWKPVVPVREGLQKTIDYFRSSR